METNVLDEPGASSVQGGQAIGAGETVSEVGNGINALLALSERVRNGVYFYYPV